jgi:RND family efflux transporter MFP subunit
VQNLEILLEKHFFFASFNGSIVSANLRVGSTARSGSLLGEIINLEEMEVVVPVEAANLHWIDHEKPVTFRSSEVPGRWTGKISRIGSDINARTQTVEVYIEVDNGQTASLLNGVFLKAHIPGRKVDKSIEIPAKAVYEDRYVYLITDGILTQREVKIVRRELDRIIIDGGLENGDTLVVEIMQGVAPGMPARSKNVITKSGGQ